VANCPNIVVDGSLWKHYKTALGLELGGYVAIVCKIPAKEISFSMYSISGADLEEKVEMLRGPNCKNLGLQPKTQRRL